MIPYLLAATVVVYVLWQAYFGWPTLPECEKDACIEIVDVSDVHIERVSFSHNNTEAIRLSNVDHFNIENVVFTNGSTIK